MVHAAAVVPLVAAAAGDDDNDDAVAGSPILEICSRIQPPVVCGRKSSGQHPFQDAVIRPTHAARAEVLGGCTSLDWAKQQQKTPTDS